ncbi:MAG: Ppx/GppA phosphatase family protein, partial [Caulobacteraceae bacterium]
MPELPAPEARARGRAAARTPDNVRAYAALDLGTNNCRLLIATPSPNGFQVLESYSRIVRLGEGLAARGRLDEAAMDRAIAALKVCAEKIKRRRVSHSRGVATQACRLAANGREFIDRVAHETGVRLKIISPRDEARLSVASCYGLLHRDYRAALVIDVGGGSTELSWLNLGDPGLGVERHAVHASSLPIHAWLSIPMGVVTLAEMFPEGDDRPGTYRAMVDAVKAKILEFKRADSLKPLFAEGCAHLVGSSGAITSLASMHLDLPRYDRARVDGLWMERAECEAATERLLRLDRQARADLSCIGPDRADLVLAGAAIMEAVQRAWPSERVRVADRGLREG